MEKKIMVDFHPEEQQTEFNQSIDVLYKIGDTRRQLCNHIYKGEYILQFQALRVYYFLLEPMLNDKEIDKHNDLYVESTKAYKEIKKQTKNKMSIPLDCIDQLDNWFRELNKDAQKHGLLMIKKQDARFALSKK